MLKLNNITYGYTEDSTIFKDFSLEVKDGEFIAILGANGSGKSTMAKIMAGIIPPDSGTVETESKNEFPVGIVFQNPSNQIVRSIVEDDTAFGLENLGIKKSKIDIKIDEVLKKTGTHCLKGCEVRNLSGGQKQKVAIAGVIAMDPDIIIFDEATSMLDPVGRKEIVSIMKSLNKAGTTVINITHHLEEVKDVDRVIFLKDGNKVGEEIPKNLHRKKKLMEECRLILPLELNIASILEKKGYSIEDPWEIGEVLKSHDKNIRS